MMPLGLLGLLGLSRTHTCLSLFIARNTVPVKRLDTYVKVGPEPYNIPNKTHTHPETHTNTRELILCKHVW